jgi:hypothetical protein
MNEIPTSTHICNISSWDDLVGVYLMDGPPSVHHSVKVPLLDHQDVVADHLAHKGHAAAVDAGVS